MASYNTRIVRRSAVLLDYGPRFRYREISAYSNPVAALVATSGLGALAGGLAFPPANCSTASSPARARGRARSPAPAATSRWSFTALAGARRSPPRATPATQRLR